MMPRKQQFKISDELNKSMVISNFRVSYEHILEPWTGDADKPARYSLQAIMDKKRQAKQLRAIKERIDAIGKEAFGPKFPALVKAGKLRQPLRDGDLEFENDSTYEGKIFFNANGPTEGKKPPGLYDQHLRDMRQLPNPEDVFFSGVYANAEIKFYPYDQQGGKGVACYLFRVQYVKTGEPLTGGAPVESVFSEIDTEEDVFAKAGSSHDEEEEKPVRRRRRKAKEEDDDEYDIDF